jgi:hypothetical protein
MKFAINAIAASTVLLFAGVAFAQKGETVKMVRINSSPRSSAARAIRLA